MNASSTWLEAAIGLHAEPDLHGLAQIIPDSPGLHDIRQHAGSRAFFDRCGDVEEDHASVPLKSSDGLFHASAAIAIAKERGSYSIAGSLRADHDLDADQFPKNESGRIYRKMDRKRRRDFGNVLTSYRTNSTPSVRWICAGDQDQIAGLLTDLRFIGKKRA